MEECEICGTGESGYRVMVEGAKLNVCSDCSKHGKLITGPMPERRRVFQKRAEKELDLVPGYGQIVKNARLKMKIERTVLAEMLNEKESFIARIEEESTRPSEQLARRMEKQLEVKLLEEITYEQAGKEEKGSKELTFGDIVVLKKKKGV
ncbi:TIGR00270 family protein [Candidatus Micrarchaeota archaeon]|nr:TIGR00270 family protein [Candidatus Micrarchaeota archaeon]